MNDLGRIEDLPQAYRVALTQNNLVPLWPSLRGVLPPKIPNRQTQPTHWAYRDIKPLLLQAGELTPIEKAERRVLVLANPGHTLEKMQASAAMYLGMQLLLPGEWAPSHRHTPNAVRMVVEGEGAYTTVQGVRCPMARGDLILPPTGLWHEHGHDGAEPVVWLDVLDLPIIYYTETSYHINGDRQAIDSEQSGTEYAVGSVVPLTVFEDRQARSSHADTPVATYPVLRYPWCVARDALMQLADAQPAQSKLQVVYTNPDTGGDAQNILGFYAQMVRPGDTVTLPVRSPAQVFHQIEGQTAITIQDQTFHMATADTCCAPGYTAVTIHNPSASDPAFLFVADESPLHRKLGVYENRIQTA